jgi:hypothetical protein
MYDIWQTPVGSMDSTKLTSCNTLDEAWAVVNKEIKALGNVKTMFDSRYLVVDVFNGERWVTKFSIVKQYRPHP